MLKRAQIRWAERFFNIFPLCCASLIGGGFLYIVGIKVAAVLGFIGIGMMYLGIINMGLGLLLLPTEFILSGLWGVYTGFLKASGAWWSGQKEKPSSLTHLSGIIYTALGVVLLIFLYRITFTSSLGRYSQHI